jgi:hypothetical protein
MGAFYFFQHPGVFALLGGVAAGLLFGLGAACFRWLGEKRLKARVLNAEDMNPTQDRTIQLPLDSTAALQKAKDALAAIRNIKNDSIQIAPNQITAITGTTGKIFGEQITVDITSSGAGPLVRIRSRPKVATTTAAYGKGRENVEVFARALIGSPT